MLSTNAPRRAALYARFSSDRQNERSCEDQAHLCRALAGQHGLTVVGEYEDRALSGASMVQRLGLHRLLRAAREKRFDVLVCEHLDRLSRDQADLASIRKELTFLGISILTYQDGEVGAIQVGLRGLMSELFLADLAQRTRRGLAGRVRQGASAGGRSYGYVTDPATKGRLLVNETEAAIVRRIFAAYLGGDNARTIAASLNRDRIPAPRGGKWNASTISGSAQRANGILQNRLYVGEIVWNRQRFIKDPATGRRVSRPNAESERQVARVPELAIVDAATFEAVQRLRAERRQVHQSHQRRPRHVFSGLIKCACCGASYTVVGSGRIGCAGYRERGDCTNHRTVAIAHVEARVLSALRDQLAAPHRIETYVREYMSEAKRLMAQRRSRRDGTEARLAELDAAIARAVDLVLAGRAPAAIVDRLHEMETEKAALEATLAAAAPDNVFELHPAAAAKYRRHVEDLQAALRNLKEGQPADHLIRTARSLVSRIVVTPPAGSHEPVGLEVHGALAVLLQASAETKKAAQSRRPLRKIGSGLASPGLMGELVAGARNSQSPTFWFAA